MSENNISSNKMSNLFNDGVLSQIKMDNNGFKIITHLDHLKDSINTHIVDRFDMNGNYIGNDYGE